MINLFIPFDAALKIRDLGFDDPCMANFHPDGEWEYAFDYLTNTNSYWDGRRCTTLTWEQAFDWFETKWKLGAYVKPIDVKYYWQIKVLENKTGIGAVGFSKFSDSKPTARYECLMKLIEIIENK